MAKNKKTNVMRLLEQHDVDYIPHLWKEMSDMDRYHNYKTLVTTGKSGDHYVFVVPAHAELDLKKAAKTVAEKNIHMLKQKDLLPLTGYVHGGCSPIGMKKTFVTVFDDSMLNYDQVSFSAGEVGKAVELNPRDVERVIAFTFAEVRTTEE
ncbi:MAG: aminoacyl-tRNA deacylase [Aerococcus sp.]|nr:aminoacyl-tRNA deacylase [Aerococcus sp.]